MNFYDIYTPLTATPLTSNDAYMEWEPCRELKPYVKCFWGSRQPYRQYKSNGPIRGLVTPDTCVDIIFTVDHSGGHIYSHFCGIDTETFPTLERVSEDRTVSVFAIRFYAWSAVFFAEDSLRNTINDAFEVDRHFSRLRREIEPLLYDVSDMAGRIRLAEDYLVRSINSRRYNHIAMDAVAELLLRRGNVEIGQLAGQIHVSSRQLERVFRDYMGISPKQLASLIRYQYVWRDVLTQPRFCILDAVERYGYTDQAHLMRDFKRFHSMNITEARRYAMEHVANLQDMQAAPMV